MRVRFKKIYFYMMFICATLALILTVGLHLFRSENVISTSTIIIAIAVLLGLIGSIIVRKKEKNNKP